MPSSSSGGFSTSRRRPFRRTVLLLACWLPLVAAAIVWGLSAGTESDANAAASTTAASTTAASTTAASTTAASTTAPAPARGKVYINARLLFDQDCAACHGTGGTGTSRGPSLKGVGEAAVDFYLSTGRMPKRATPHKPPAYTAILPEAQIKALDKYVTALVAHGGPGIPKVVPSAGSIAQGGDIFRDDCAACHGFAGRGGELTDRPIPELKQATPRQVGEAVRVGPDEMPNFGTEALSAKQVDSIAAYINYTKHTDNKGGADLGLLEPFSSGWVTWAVVIPVVIGFLLLIGKRDKLSEPQ